MTLLTLVTLVIQLMTLIVAELSDKPPPVPVFPVAVTAPIDDFAIVPATDVPGHLFGPKVPTKFPPIVDKVWLSIHNSLSFAQMISF